MLFLSYKFTMGVPIPNANTITEMLRPSEAALVPPSTHNQEFCHSSRGIDRARERTRDRVTPGWWPGGRPGDVMIGTPLKCSALPGLPRVTSPGEGFIVTRGTSGSKGISDMWEIPGWPGIYPVARDTPFHSVLLIGLYAHSKLPWCFFTPKVGTWAHLGIP